MKEGTLDFNAAVRKARHEVGLERLAVVAAADGPVLTVGLAAENYIADRDARQSKRAGRLIRSDTSARLGRYLLGQPARGKQKAVPAAPLVSIALYLLKETDLLQWRASLPATLKETAKQRLTTDLKAALNQAFARNRKRLDPAMPSVIKYGLKVGPIDDDETIPLARENQILSDSQVGQLLKATQSVDAAGAWEGDLFRLVVVLAATGARFSQIVRMRVGDCQCALGRLIIPASRKGKSGSNPVPVGSDVLDVIRPAVTGRSENEFLLTRWRHKQVPGGIRWVRSDRGPWQTASELTVPCMISAIRLRCRMSFHTHCGIPVSFGASDKELPIRLVAAVHDTSVQMIEKHYARWISDGLEELVARSVVPLLPRDEA